MKLMCIQRLYSKVIFCLIICIIASCSNKGKDYKDIFGQKYKEAENYINSNKWIQDSIARYGIDPTLAIPIVFPELIRYSAIKDIIETHGLEVLYAQYGSKYADFSIGRFQMKPSFAYQLEKDWNEFNESIPIKCQIRPFNLIDNPKSRIDRIIRLRDEKWQIKYLVMFLKIIKIKHKVDLNKFEQEIRFIASAYNSGYSNDSAKIAKMGKRSFFHTEILIPRECFNYSDISVYYYKKNCRK